MTDRTIKVEGTDQLRDLAARLKTAGDKKTLNALRKGIRDAADPAVKDVAQVVRALDVHGVSRGESPARSGGSGSAHTARLTYDVLQSRGDLSRVLERAHGRAGLRDTTARALTTTVAASGRSASVRIRVDTRRLPPDQRKLPSRMEKGEWWHPVMGNRRVWVQQKSTPNWFGGTLRKHRDPVRESIRQEVQKVTRSI